MMRTSGLVVVSALAALVSIPATAANLISHFEFDTDGTNSSTAPDGTLSSGASIDNTTFKVGSGAANFDGIDDFVAAGTGGVPGLNGAYYQGTVAFWFKADSGIQTGSRRFVGQQNGNPFTFGSDNRMSFEISTNSAGSVQAFIRTADGTESNNRYKFRHQEPGSVFPTDWADGSFHHLAFAWSVDAAGNRESQIYIDGFEVDTVVTEASLEANPTTDPILDWESPGLYIGARNNRILQGGSADGHVDGWIDDFRVYDGFLTLPEIRSLPAVVPEPMGASLACLGALMILPRKRGRR